jgi:hypothetical protein
MNATQTSEQRGNPASAFGEASMAEKPIQTSDTKGLSAVLREWAGNYEEGSFDTEAGLMTEAADALDLYAAVLVAVKEALLLNDPRQLGPILRIIDKQLGIEPKGD